MTLDELKVRLKAISLNELALVASAANVPYGTALKIRGGYTKNPRIRTVEALAARFSEDGLPADLRQQPQAAE